MPIGQALTAARLANIGDGAAPVVCVVPNQSTTGVVGLIGTPALSMLATEL
ncbi:MAG: hypothetical protein FWG65_04855 [Turicibacter sp.]|nr:hypothetical protein [Turicibacter sp.]